MAMRAISDQGMNVSVCDAGVRALVALTPTKSERGLPKEQKKKDNPFTRSLPNRKEFLLMSHDSVNEQARQLPMPSRQHVEEYVLQHSQALEPLAQGRGATATPGRLHLSVGRACVGLLGSWAALRP